MEYYPTDFLVALKNFSSRPAPSTSSSSTPYISPTNVPIAPISKSTSNSANNGILSNGMLGNNILTGNVQNILPLSFSSATNQYPSAINQYPSAINQYPSAINQYPLPSINIPLHQSISLCHQSISLCQQSISSANNQYPSAINQYPPPSIPFSNIANPIGIPSGYAGNGFHSNGLFGTLFGNGNTALLNLVQSLAQSISGGNFLPKEIISGTSVPSNGNLGQGVNVIGHNGASIINYSTNVDHMASNKNAVSSAAVGGVNANRNYGGNNGHGIAITLPDISSALLGSTYSGNIGVGEKLPTDSILSKYVR
ncbi:hypothetical protein CEXT_62551 [Caerostris extrusa]|uniref:Uncharacterized protein n=1 Tax=Caerostris extrusa TaxID=172846 RepID=A0AAV4M6N4_CAEEX|nr:hypothetical protein CEXT_62551 [Caerostris extrusa]